MSLHELCLANELIPQPLTPRVGGVRTSMLEAMVLLENYHILAMVTMATHSIVIIGKMPDSAHEI